MSEQEHIPQIEIDDSKKFIAWVRDNGMADWNYYDARDKEVYAQCKILAMTDNQRMAVSASVDYNLNRKP